MNDLAKQMIEDQKKADQERANNITKLWKYYYGHGFSDSLKTIQGKPNDNIKVNYAKLIVNKGVMFLFGDEIKFDIVYPDTNKDNLQNDVNDQEKLNDLNYIDYIWKINQKDTFLLGLAQQGCVSGHVFVKIVEKLDGNHRLINIDPSYVKVFFDPHDIKDINKYVIEFTAIGDNYAPISIKQTIERVENGASYIWIIKESRYNEKTKESEILDDVIWNYPYSPMVHCQNLLDVNSFYGISDLEDDIIDVIKAINFVLSNINRIIRFHAHPKTWGRGFTVDQLDISVDDLLVINNPDGILSNLEMSSDLSSSLTFYTTLKRILLELAQIPEIALGETNNISVVSGVALKILYQQLIEKTKSKRVLYGDLIKDINIRLLMLNNSTAIDTKINWFELLPTDEAQLRLALESDSRLGVSNDTILEKLGYNAQVERDKRNKENVNKNSNNDLNNPINGVNNG